ncbi:MAG: hypothetical protein JZU65_05625 [Chlorobium sp.]|nr:hypothetical protein [Chlorobium sp.]
MSYGKSIDFLFNQMRNSSLGSLAGGWLYFYSAGTTSLKDVYLDREMTQVAANPYQMTADGTAELFGNGIYRVVVKSSAMVIIYDYDNVEIEPSVVLDTMNTTLVDASFVSQALVLPDVTDQIIIRVDATDNSVEILPTVGCDFYDGQQIFLYNQWESIKFHKIGLVYYVV